MRRKRRSKYTWFPTLGTNLGDGGDDEVSFRLFRCPVSPGQGQSGLIVFPIVPDVPMEGTDISNDLPGQLSQALGQEYFIERIAGRIDLAIPQIPSDIPSENFFPNLVYATCGFFVARANDRQSGGGQNTPIGSASLSEFFSNYGPAAKDAIREPWMWRRSWLLVNLGHTFADPAGGIPGWFTSFDGNANMGRGSVSEGTHFDIKSVRRVGADDRLFFVAQTTVLDNALDIQGQIWQQNVSATPIFAQPDNPAMFMTGILDCRVLGQLRKAKSSGKF